MRRFLLCSAALATTVAAGAIPHATAQPALANPASQHCVAVGGTLTIERNPRGAEYGVCLFAENRQCEEWAMLRGQCRAGGIKVTGYTTQAARYCAITGGSYRGVSSSNTTAERGTCKFGNGKRCDAFAYYEGSCAREALTGAGPAEKSIHARFVCSGGRSIEATFVDGENSHVRLVLSDGRKLTVPQARSASGARYASAGDSFVFWNKGNTAFIEEAAKTTFDGCTTTR